MARNYLLLPENIQRRPLPGHRHRLKRDKVPESFTPYSRAGRRAPGEAKIKTAKEMSGAGLLRFIKKLNNFLAGRPTLPDGEATKAAPALTVTNDQGTSGYLCSQLPQKHSMADNVKSSTIEVVDARPVKRPGSNAIAGSSRARLEGLSQPQSPVNNTVNPIGTAESDHTYGDAEQRSSRKRFHPHELLPDLNPTQSHVVITEHAVHGVSPPVFPDHIVSHQPANQLDFVFHVHEAPNHPAPVFPLYNDFEIRNNDGFELERVPIACAHAGMGGPMDIDPAFPTLIPNDAYADLSLERATTACAYAGMDEPMDTTPDDTQGPMIHFVPQEPHVMDPPGFPQYVPPQHALFEPDVILQPPMYQTLEPLEHQRFVDQDQRLQRPIHVYPINQQLHQEHLVRNQIFPVQANQFPVMEEYFPLAPRFDIGYVIQQYPGVPIPLQPLEPIDRQFMLYPPAHEELIDELHILPLVNEIVGHDRRIAYQTIGAGELAHLGNNRFMDPEAGELFELFGIGDEDDDGDNDDEDDDDDNDDE